VNEERIKMSAATPIHHEERGVRWQHEIRGKKREAAKGGRMQDVMTERTRLRQTDADHFCR